MSSQFHSDETLRTAAAMKAIGDQIERLIALYDGLDGDADLEPDLAGTPNLGAACDAEGDDSDRELSGDENEPSLGSLGSCGAAYTLAQAWAGGINDGRELEDGDLEPDHEGEPSLGSLDRMVNQERWTSTNDSLDACSDREHDDCDLEDSHDREASDLAGVGSTGNLEGDNCDLESSGDEEPHLGWTETGALGSTTDLEQCVTTGFVLTARRRVAPLVSAPTSLSNIRPVTLVDRTTGRRYPAVW